METALAVLVKSPRWQQGRQRTVTPLFLELLEGPQIAGKAGTWREAMEGVAWVYPEQEDPSPEHCLSAACAQLENVQTGLAGSPNGREEARASALPPWVPGSP